MAVKSAAKVTLLYPALRFFLGAHSEIPMAFNFVQPSVELLSTGMAKAIKGCLNNLQRVNQTMAVTVVW